MSTAVMLRFSLPPRAKRVAGRAGVGGSLLLISQITPIANLIAPTPDPGSPRRERRGVPRSPRAARGGGEDVPLALSIRSI